MKKKDILRKSLDYTRIINKKNNFSNKFFSIYIEKSLKTTFGITVPTKTGTAVLRNKIKRQIKNIIDKNAEKIKNEYNYVIIIRKSLIDLDYKSKQEELLKLFQRIGEKNEE